MKDKTLADMAPAERLAAGVLLAALMTVGFWPKFVTAPVNDALNRFKLTAPATCGETCPAPASVPADNAQ